MIISDIENQQGNSLNTAYEEYRKDLIIIEIVSLVMHDYDSLVSDKKHIPYQDIFIVNIMLIICIWQMIYGNSENSKIAAGFFSGVGVLYDILLMLNLCCNKSKRMQDEKAARILMQHKHLFVQEENFIIVFRREDYGNELKYSLLNNKFQYTKGSMQRNQTIKFFSGVQNHSRIALRSLYSHSNDNNAAGKLLRFTLLSDQSKNFAGPIAFEGGEWLFTSGDQNCRIFKIYQSHKDEFDYIKNKYLCDLRESELKILSKMFCITQQLFTRPYSGSALKEIADISFYIDESKGVCRHKAFVLAKLFFYAKQDGYVDGEISFQQKRLRFLCRGHAWLEYLSKHSPNKLIIDPEKDVLFQQKKLPMCCKLRYAYWHTQVSNPPPIMPMLKSI